LVCTSYISISASVRNGSHVLATGLTYMLVVDPGQWVVCAHV